MLDVHVFVKQHKLVDLVQYIVLVESIFCFYCITVRPAIFSLPKARNIVIRHWVTTQAIRRSRGVGLRTTTQ